MNNLNKNIINTFYENFKNIYHTILINAYYNAIEDKKYDLDWKENQFTNYLVCFMRKDELVNKHQIWVKVQVQPDNFELPVNENDPDKQPIIDIWYASWNKYKCEYFIESKNLSENNWTKRNGSNVDSSKQRARYIDTGIDNILEYKYPYNCCLAAYIVNGNIDKTHKKLNNLLIKRKRNEEILSNIGLMKNFNYSYISKHKNKSFELIHFFLDFT